LKKIMQTRFGGYDSPVEEQGNCLQACVASVFELSLEEAFDGIPHGENWFEEFNKWLERYGLAAIFIEHSPQKPVAASALFGYHIGEVQSKTLTNGEHHNVVLLNGEVIHDPNPNANGIGEAVAFILFVPLDPIKLKLV
jgi:hypothetical protein